MLVLFTDTDTDITPIDAEELGYHLISMPYSIRDEEFWPYEESKEFDFKAYYEVLRKGVVPKTFAISPSKYIEYFQPFLANGDDILYVHFSKAMSGTFSAMNLAIEELSSMFPNQKIYTLDTKGITICSNAIVKEVARLYKNNKTIEEIMEWASKEVDRFATYFYADDLKFFSKSGRVSNFSAVMGTIFGIHPIINMDSNGVMKAVTKARGRLGSLKKIMEYVSDLADDIGSYPIVIGHTDSLELAQKLGEMLKNKFGNDLKIDYVTVNPTAGAHCGPDTIGICFHAKHR